MKRAIQALLLGIIALSLAACAPGTAVSQAEQQIQSQAQQVRSRLPFAQAPIEAQAAIQMVIQRGNFEQEQAIKGRDSSIMKDTSTDPYYQQLSQNNQAMLDSGVTAIKLIKIEWGQISVSGNNATANTYETWATNYSDGSNNQSRDHNVYSLIQQDGGWKIQSDDQPDNPAASASPSGNAQPTRPSPSGRGSSQPAPSVQPSSGAAPVISSPAAKGTVEAAVEQVIQRGNAEQEQAIAKRDSSVMKDTSTDSYYKDLAQSNQDMIDNGVTAIKLIKLDWGTVTVTGNTASVTTYETWSTTYSDGSTDQSPPDRNVYTLVQQNGSWKVQSDDHPDNGFQPAPAPAGTQPGGPGSSPSAPASPPAPILPRGRGQSSNWSGYAASGGKFTGVTGTWTVPQPTATGSVGADAAWVGIGGERSRDLIQAGTEETVLSSGRTQYDAWIEMLPQYSHPIPLAVHPGDSVTVSIHQQQPGSWAIDFKNNTTGATYNRTVQYSSTLSSAEWVEEAPSGGRGGVLPLSNFGSINFTKASAVKDGKTVTLSQANASPITMINGSDQPLATPSAVSADGSSFSVTRTSNVSTPGRGRRGIG